MLSLRTTVLVFGALALMVLGAQLRAADAASVTAAPTPSATPATVKKTKSSADMNPPSAADTKQLKALDQKFQSSKSISMKLEKTFTLAVLDKKETTTGSLLVSKGRLRMEMDPPNHKLIIVGDQGVWVVDYPPAEFKDARLQVAHATGEKKSAVQQGLLGSLLKGRLSSFFKVTNVEVEKGEKTFFLTPKKVSVECNRAQVVLAKDGKEMRELRYWDEQGNETIFHLTDVKIDAPVAEDAFNFTPPANADVTPL